MIDTPNHSLHRTRPVCFGSILAAQILARVIALSFLTGIEMLWATENLLSRTLLDRDGEIRTTTVKSEFVFDGKDGDRLGLTLTIASGREVPEYMYFTVVLVGTNKPLRIAKRGALVCETDHENITFDQLESWHKLTSEGSTSTERTICTLERAQLEQLVKSKKLDLRIRGSDRIFETVLSPEQIEDLRRIAAVQLKTPQANP